MLLIAAGSLWLFLAAVPALADGGPHVASANSGVSSLTADGCAGCHRAHTAQGPLLLIAQSEEELCLSCHGAGTGATADVLTGVQYSLGTDGLRDTPILGALRGGGFEETRIGNPFRYAIDNGSGSVSRKSKIEVADAGSPVTSAHLAMAENGLTNPGIMWGNGQNGTGAGPAVSIGCASCHNPHGNGNYRILNPMPTATDATTLWASSIVDYGVSAAGRFRTAASHGFLVGDEITVTGASPAGVNVTATVATVPASNTFTLTGVAVAGTGNGGVAERIGGVSVIDAAAPPAGDERNYTVIQTSMTDGLTLLASEAAAYSSTAGDYLHYQIPWNETSSANYNRDAPNGLGGGTLGNTTFGQQITVWCATCHTRYWAASEPTTSPPNGTVGAAYSNPRPGDDIFTYQHRTRAESGRSCLTCHVSHGTSAVMDGTYSSTVPLPDGTVSDSSRLLKVDNRGTCQMCHDPTGTIVIGDQYPPAPYPVPSTP